MPEKKDVEEPKWLLELNKEQAEVTKLALEFYFRMCLSQFDMIERIIPYKKQRELKYHHYNDYLLKALKQKLFPELPENAYHGIYEDSIPSEAQIACDIYQAIRYRTSWDLHPPKDMHERMLVIYDEPRSISGKEIPVVKKKVTRKKK